MKRHLLLALLASVALSACTLPGARTAAIEYYVLDMATEPSTAPTLSSRQHPMLLLRDIEASGFAQSSNLVYRRSAGTQAYYQYARWSEAPPKRLHTLLRHRLQASGLYAGVMPLGSGVSGNSQLNVRLLDFYHDAQTAPGVARISLEAALIKRDSAQLLAQRSFAASAPVARADAAAAAAALGQASDHALTALIEWLATLPPDQLDAPATVKTP